jgi:hypothetical protein
VQALAGRRPSVGALGRPGWQQEAPLIALRTNIVFPAAKRELRIGDHMNSTDKARVEMEALERAENADQMGGRQLWQRQVGESAKAYHAFTLYRDMMEKRTLAKVGKELGCSSTNVERWARRWAWTRRTYEYDLVQEEEWRV